MVNANLAAADFAKRVADLGGVRFQTIGMLADTGVRSILAMPYSPIRSSSIRAARHRPYIGRHEIDVKPPARLYEANRVDIPQSAF